eukprot:scaffold325991_cov62-Tisochrysis_lutea.AAC.1
MRPSRGASTTSHVGQGGATSRSGQRQSLSQGHLRNAASGSLTGPFERVPGPQTGTSNGCCTQVITRVTASSSKRWWHQTA